MNRIWLGAGVAIALLIGLVVALISSNGATSTTTTVALATTTTAAPATTTTAPTTTTAAPATTTTEAPTTTTNQSLEDREAEVLALVTDLEFRMTTAIYGGDVDTLGELIGTERLFDALSDAAANPSEYFVDAPTSEQFKLELFDVKLDRDDCLVVDVTEDPTAFLNESGEVEQLIIVLWPVPESEFGWRIAERFGGGSPESSWLPQCDSQNREWRP